MFYKIIHVDTDNCAIHVRYWSDEFSQQDLKTFPNDMNESPKQCRYDYRFNIWNPNMSEEELHKFIIRNAPVPHFELMSKVKNPNIDTSLEIPKSLLNKEFSIPPAPPGPKITRIDLSDELKK